MLICRIRLRRGQLFTHAFQLRRSLSDIPPYPPVKNDSASVVVRELPPHQEPRLPPPNPPRPRPPLPSPPLSTFIERVPHDGGHGTHILGSDHEEEAQAGAEGHASSLRLQELYSQLQAGHDKTTAMVTSADVKRIAARARRKGHAVVLDNLARNVLVSQTEPLRFQSVLILLIAKNLPMLTSHTIASLLLAISDPSGLSLSPLRAAWIATTILHDLRGSLTDEILTALITLLSNILSSPSRPSSAWKPEALVWSAFELTLHLSVSGRRESALKLFQLLIDTQYIPPEAIQSVDLSSKNFRLIVALTFIRSCLHWNWRSRASTILRDYIIPLPTLDLSTVEVCTEVLYALADFPSVEDLGLSVSLIKSLASRTDPVFVPDGLIRQLYETALRLEEPSTAGHFYSFARSEAIRSKHEYPPPNGPALPWLLRHFAVDGVYLRLARALVMHVVARGEPIPPTDRAPFITVTAELGFATQARKLWERYSAGRHRLLVVGNGALVVRMCSLFANVVKREELKAEKDRVAAGDGEAADYDGASSSEKRLADYSEFSSNVLEQYRNAKEPVARASREDLNALARANFILGNMTSGFAALRVLIDRHEIPDAHDVNVALSAVAQYSASAALEMMERMTTQGPPPDSVTLGTVIHHAGVQRDAETIQRALALAKRLAKHATVKTVVSMIRASVRLSGDDKEAVRANLMQALPIVAANAHRGGLGSPRLGYFCAEEALGAGDAVLAFRFWQLLVRSRTEWYSPQQAGQRGRIASGLRRMCAAGEASVGETRRLLRELKEEGGDPIS
ncbi:hypothetical protein FA95DRAFT_1676235 [Auriscalpium vulgare]|uniref:Uncharacterized protein n=1 Tax=Auriscalpium vulgare TaxID=40419 RepID=A0ACB8S5F5_9AGAM|nr:hypothetical protein FA95DRAFT_1676235 [Auriscalpium vulgare]